mgnify:CR=1 FL=1
METKGCRVGEMSPQELWDSTMNPETRNLIQITVNDVEDTEEALSLCMGKDVDARREFILEEFK